MLFGDDFIADRQSEPGALATRFCGEKRLEELVPDLGRNAAAVVAHPHLNGFAKIVRGHRQCWSEVRTIHLSLAFIRGVEGIAEEIEEHARHILRHKRDRRDIFAVGSFYRHVEVLILSAGAVIGEIERLFDQPVEVDVLSIAAAAAGMRQHPFDDIVGAFSVLDDFFKIAGKRVNDFVNIAALFLPKRGQRRRGPLLQFVEQLDRQASEIIDEVERVLDLVGDAGG